MLLFLQATEKPIEQTFGGSQPRRQRSRASEGCGSNQHDAAPHPITSQVCTQRLLHPNVRIPRGEFVLEHNLSLVAGW
jgi:hypothetical protein